MIAKLKPVYNQMNPNENQQILGGDPGFFDDSEEEGHVNYGGFEQSTPKKETVPPIPSFNPPPTQIRSTQNIGGSGLGYQQNMNNRLGGPGDRPVATHKPLGFICWSRYVVWLVDRDLEGGRKGKEKEGKGEGEGRERRMKGKEKERGLEWRYKCVLGWYRARGGEIGLDACLVSLELDEIGFAQSKSVKFK